MRLRPVLLALLAVLGACAPSGSGSTEVDATGFEVRSARYFLRHRTIWGEEPVLELNVRNGTAHRVSRVHFRGTLRSPSRSAPVLEADFVYEPENDLPSGERATWIVAPGRGSVWGTVNAPRDAKLSVEVLRLDGR